MLPIVDLESKQNSKQLIQVALNVINNDMKSIKVACINRTSARHDCVHLPIGR